VSDFRLPALHGVPTEASAQVGRQVIEVALGRYPGIIAIVVTGYGTVKDAVDMIKLGAADFIAKPFQFDELMHVLNKAFEQRRLASENAYLHEQLDERFGLGSMVGKSAPMRSLFQLIETVAPTATTILISGETGTGKEMVARAIHQTSPRHRGRFVAINVSAIPETLLDAELFGHAKGAFTGAVAMRQGRLEQADGGTLFLDEVGDMSLPAQAKLLRVLQEGVVTRIGGAKPIQVDVRVLAATNKDLEAEIAEQRFREDLLYRLNVVPIEVPALRERLEDVAALVAHFADQLAASAGVPGKKFADDAVARLRARVWPGNIRELRNAVERALILAPGRVVTGGDIERLLPTADGAAVPAAVGTGGQTFEDFKQEAEKSFLAQQLRLHDWNVSETARALKMPRSNLYKKLERYGLTREST
jgi:two-component system nitrogen regulation response regulator NtrX